MTVVHTEYAGISGEKETALITRCGLAIAGISGVDLQIRNERKAIAKQLLVKATFLGVADINTNEKRGQNTSTCQL